MTSKIYTFKFSPDWMLLTNAISKIDRFDASWTSVEKKEGKTLRQLKSIATVKSVGASTRIEGSKMTDDEVEALISNLQKEKLEDRDQQEVAGYYEVLELIESNYQNIDITENNLKHLHNQLMKYSSKDAWHRGDYKQQSNVVEAENPDGSTYEIFRTTQPGLETTNAMRGLIEWYNSDTQTNPIIKCALTVYDFLSIHPFQDGNGRLSRLLGTLLLLKHGYSWIQYVSFEHEIENRKKEYYRVLMQCQAERPGEDVYPWVLFFIDCMKNIQEKLNEKLQAHAQSSRMPQRQKKIYSFIESNPGSSSGVIATKLGMQLPTVKKDIAEMVENKLIARHGSGPGTHYTVEGLESLKHNVSLILTNDDREKELLLQNQRSFIEIKKIILTPLFDWKHPDEWSKLLIQNGLVLEITCEGQDETMVSQKYVLSGYVSPHHFQPVFELKPTIHIPESLWEKIPYKKAFPLEVKIKLSGEKAKFDFTVMIVYDKG